MTAARKCAPLVKLQSWGCVVSRTSPVSRKAGVSWEATSSRKKGHGRQPDLGNPTVPDETGGLRKREQWWN